MFRASVVRSALGDIAGADQQQIVIVGGDPSKCPTTGRYSFSRFKIVRREHTAGLMRFTFHVWKYS